LPMAFPSSVATAWYFASIVGDDEQKTAIRMSVRIGARLALCRNEQLDTELPL
jgi:hypothetical protein